MAYHQLNIDFLNELNLKFQWLIAISVLEEASKKFKFDNYIEKPAHR